MEKYIVSALVQNRSGVLARVSSLFGRRGFNIDSLTVSPTTDEKISRVTIIVIGDEYTLGQVLKQMAKLEECIKVVQIEEEAAFCWELLLVKIRGGASVKESVREICDVYGAAVLETHQDTIIVRMDGAPSKINQFLSVVSIFDIVESSRTGVTAIHKEEKNA